MSRGAFTLVEVLIVVIILGILAAAIIPQFSEAADDAHTNTAAVIVKSMQRQISVKKAEDGTWPTTIDATWFEGGVLPSNPFDPDPTTTIQLANHGQNLHPGTKTIHSAGAFWYNLDNGVIRARVTACATTTETIALYNAVNGTRITSLSQTN